MSDLKNTMRDAVRKLAFRTSVDQLRKKGVDKINVLGIDRVVRLIEEAVHRSLKDRMLGLERRQVAHSARQEFMELLRNNEDLQRSREELELRRQETEQELESLLAELATEQEALRHKLAEAARARRSTMEGEDAALAESVKSLFQELAGRRVDLVDVQEQVLELVIGLVSEERRQAVAAKEALHDSEVDRLQRRIHKLAGSLELTEQRLHEAFLRPRVDDGIASIYREVQGLSRSETQYDKKRDLMASIFEANLAMQKGVAS